MASVQVPRSRSIVLSGIDWQTYTRLLRIFAERPSVRLTYDRGELEIMSPMRDHERSAYLLGRMVDVITEELGIPVGSGRSTTLRRRRKRRGLEPDNSYWIQNESRVRSKDRIDLRVDPPPDLAIEVDVTSSSLNRMRIYASLGVPEVWRCVGPTLTFQVLGPDGRYTEATHSRAFPFLRAADLMRFLALQRQTDETTLVQQFRAWVRTQVTPPRTSP
jgi:Uma2 family endonuclease